MRIPSRFRPHGGFIMMRLGCFGLLIALGLLMGGGQALYTVLRNRQPVTLTVKEYLAHRPDAEWVRLTDTHVDLAECATSGFAGAITELYIPVRTPGEDRSNKVGILLKTKDAQLISLVEELKSAGRDPAKLSKIVAGHRALLVGPREITGLVQIGLDSDDKTRSKLAGLHMNLVPSFVVIADGESPSLLRGLAMSVGGLALGFFLLRRKASAGAPPPLIPNLPPRHFGDPPPPPLPPK